MVTRFLFNTRLGDVLCKLIEHVTGCALVPLADIDCKVEATAAGKAAAKVRAPASVS